ncbi:hypothetical protein B9Z55_025417 [Caenorhabditis nigoni]|uniref:Uncharacterized protein n=3 Tax=Caenorhabditis nigoni TaxID=1611254 RepID=A0A2G5SYU6_9PELO|nr:hypothetical protein B9Z55_025417 [Caenorhabditis nigoni]
MVIMESATRHRADMISFFTFDSYISIVGVAYTAVGLLGVFCNVTTVVMILTNRVFRLSAYTIMANVALADSIVMLIVDCQIALIDLARLDNRLKSTQVDLSRFESIIVLSRLSEKVDLKSTQVDFKST